MGRFRYTFTVPKDKKRKLGKRALTLAYVTDGSSGVSCSARIRQGPISGFSLDKVETLRLFPVMPAVQVKKTKFYTNNTYVRDHAGFSVLIGSSDAQSSGKAFWAAVDYNYDSGTVDLVGRLPAGKAFSTTLPLVASYYANDSWSVNEAYNYRAVEVAPLVAADNDGEVYVIKIPADPSEFYNNASVGHEAVGLYAWNRFGPGLFGRHSGAYTRNSRKESLLSARAVVSASPKLKIAFNETPWSVATTLSTAVDSTTINVASNGKATYEFDNLTGLWKFSFIYNGLLYMFEGTPTQGSGFAGIVGRSADGKSWAWGAAKVE